MARLKFRVHPLFYIFGLYFALTGKVFSFLAYTFSAIIHELGHYFTSERFGYKLDKIVLMPYGAVIKGDISNLRYKDEILIAIAGPLTNLCVAVACVALWWLFPSVYPFTELMATSSFALVAVNLLPCYPLDGGRVLYATLSIRLERKKAKKIAKIVSLVVAVLLFGLFVYSIFVKVNLSLLFFSIFVFSGAFSFGGSNYVKVYESLKNEVKTQLPIKRIAISENMQVRAIYRLISEDYYLELAVYSNGILREITSEKLAFILENANPYSLIKEVI